MSSQRYSESRTIQEQSRHGNDGYGVPYTSRVTVPIQHTISSYNDLGNERRVQDRLRTQDTTVQWVNDPISGRESFRVTVNIDGFNQNEVNIRFEGNKLVVYGEHIENNNQNTAKKLIEKSYELPRDLDTYSPRVTYPTPITMQIDIPSRHSNVIIDDGRTSSKLISNYDTSYRTQPRYSQEKTSSEYTSTRKLGTGGGGSGGSTYRSTSTPRIYSTFDDGNTGRNNTYSSTSRYQSRDSQSPIRRGYIDSTSNLYNTNLNTPTYTYTVTSDDTKPRIIYPTISSGNNDSAYEKKFSETHRETRHRRSSPTTGVQSSHEVQHNRSGSPSIGRNFDENRFRTSLNIGSNNIIPSTSSRNVEVREFSQRVGGDTNNNTYVDNIRNYQPSLFTAGFNSDAFYRSAFQPQIFTDDHGQNRIEMKLDVQNYDPNDIKVSVNGNDLIVQAEHNVNRPPTTSSRAYFYKQITLPSNTDLQSISSQYRADGKLHITAKLSNDQASIRYH
ncbi:unnamed protein product [Rotaria sordida]|uniref:SHSP domain-containing protein n=1 Tax=Rotaria sordida TaxID=392033 RepID=A0A813R7G9_9BILA|nr:unnamed protein product [Rotaria sordida]CAF0855618.1 unnamed protein product [Rotaria sordida]